MEENRNIVLIGMPGAGKSYMGVRLARLLVHFTFIDIDEEIETEAGMKISEIFEKYGEEYFRDLESRIIKETSAMKNLIISIGGGAFQNQKNIDALKENGLTFYLRTSPNELFNRVKDETHRPLFKDNLSIEPIENLLKIRENNYMKADFVIDTDNKQAYTILNDILSEYENYDKP